MCAPFTAIAFGKSLNKVSNYKHQSWYVHYLVYVVPQQLYRHGNTWSFSTCAIESRGARLKRTGRRNISWRPFSAAKAVYSYIDSRTNLPVSLVQGYNSSPMMQMMKRICYLEATWHDTSSVFVRPSRLRLQRQLRASKLKCEIPDSVSVTEAVSMIEALQKRAARTDYTAV
eukprot:3117852-Pleurochrysis_carterae.AAC.2